MNLFKELNIKYPIMQGGMANIATHELASAVTLAGALGNIGTGGWDAKKSEEEILLMKKAVGDLPFSVNVMLMNPHASDIIDVCIKHSVAMITTGAGNPGQYVERIKAGGVKIVPVVPSVALARRMEKLGVDAVVVEGGESGGHVGEATTMALVPQVVEAINIPVIAAGGIASSSQYVAALALGAVGVQIGTVLLATDECPIHENYKLQLIKAKDTGTTVTGRIKGVPVRSLKTKMTRTYQKLEATDIKMEELELLTLGSLRKAVVEGNVDEGSFMAGQVAGMIKEVKPVATVIKEMVDVQNTLNHIKEVNEIV